MSTLLWALWAAGVGALAAGAAYVVEPVARALRWPTRALWAAALLAQVAVVAWPLLVAGTAPPHGAFVGAWMAATVAAACLYLRALRLLRRERGRWRVTVAEEMPVWVSERTGPAVVGFVRSIVVAPAWALAMRDRERRLLLRHEAEHVAAWDPTLLLAGLIACALVPWSPAAWWALARLRLAIEVDCDRRVLRAEPDVAAYGELLVAVQGRVVPDAATMAAFAERRLPIEERIEAMTARVPRGAAWRWSMRGAVAAVLVLGACVMPVPRTMIVVVQQPGVAPSVPATTTPAATSRGGSEPSAGGDARDAEISHRILQRIIRDYLTRADVRPIDAFTKVIVAIDSDGSIVGDERAPWKADANGGYSYGYDSDSMPRIFRRLPMSEFIQGGAFNLGSIFPDTTLEAAVIYAYRPGAGDPQRAATARAIARLFGPAGAPRDTSVGVVASFAPDWSLLEVRRLAADSVPTILNVRPGVRERLLPSLRGREVDLEGASTGGGEWGLAAGSVVHVWRVDDRPVGSPGMSWIGERVGEAIDARVDRKALPHDSATVWVLVGRDGRAQEVVVDPRTIRGLNSEDVTGRFGPAVRVERYGFLDGPPYRLPKSAVVIWALEKK